MAETPHAPSPDYQAQEERAVQHLLDSGVTLGAPITLTARQRRSGHLNCVYHLVQTATGEDVDGGAASTLAHYLDDGTYGGSPSDYTLHPVTR